MKKKSRQFWSRVILCGGFGFCLYLACWEATATWGALDLWESIRAQEQANVPIYVAPDGQRWVTPVGFATTSPFAFVLKVRLALRFRDEERYYLWMFGPIYELESEMATASVGTSMAFPMTNDFNWESYWADTDTFRFRSPVPRLVIIATVGAMILAVWTLKHHVRMHDLQIRFSMRTLTILTAVFGAYCALWQVTNRWGVYSELGASTQQIEIARRGIRGYAITPFVVCVESPGEIYPSGETRGKHRHYVAWIPGGRNIPLYPRYLKTLD